MKVLNKDYRYWHANYLLSNLDEQFNLPNYYRYIKLHGINRLPNLIIIVYIN